MAWLASLKTYLAPLSAPKLPESAVAGCYAAIVNQARQPAFYIAGQVLDTPQGRFELIMLHAFLVMRRLHDEPAFTQALFDLMFADFDLNLRELGVGDMGVGKRVKSWAQAFKGRAIAYDAGLADPAALAEAVSRNIFAGSGKDASMIAEYMQQAAKMLGAQFDDQIKAGQIDWPPVAGTSND